MKWRRLQYSKRRSGRKKEAVKTANQSKTGPNLNLCPIRRQNRTLFEVPFSDRLYSVTRLVDLRHVRAHSPPRFLVERGSAPKIFGHLGDSDIGRPVIGRTFVFLTNESWERTLKQLLVAYADLYLAFFSHPLTGILLSGRVTFSCRPGGAIVEYLLPVFFVAVS
jgi:hypothetical protein